MRKDLMELVFILDRSGSMSGLEEDTIGGYNSMLNKQRNGEGDVNVTTILFDDDYEILYDRADIKKVPDITNNEYYSRGATALLDAVGKTITYMVNVQKFAKEDEKAGKVLFIITTDGYENSSTEYSYRKVKSMIERQKVKYDWQFIFLGANIDAYKAAEKFGIDRRCASNYVPDKMGVKLNYDAMNKAVSSVRADGKIDYEWNDEVTEDFKMRRKK